MAALSIADVSANVTVGVDTHKHSHLARAKDGLGRHLGQLEIETNPHGYADLLDWAQGFGSVLTFGIEGTSSYGAGLTRFLRARGQVVIEVLRPDAEIDASEASPILSMPMPPRVLSNLAGPRPHPRPAMRASSWAERSRSRSRPRSRHGPKQ